MAPQWIMLQVFQKRDMEILVQRYAEYSITELAAQNAGEESRVTVVSPPGEVS